ncbi:MAG: hypothetical protein FIA94_13745 [Nitrospirae bacterium]|nr:hypothetical protein [Nitrospirota bacterium]
MDRPTGKTGWFRIMAGGLLLLTAAIPVAAFAVSYPAQLYHREERRDVFVKGDIVYLFHSGTDVVKDAVHVNDTLAVHRITPLCEVVPVGLIKVTSFVGETYIRGEVLAGEIRPDDVARKEKVSCLVISADMCQK